MKVATLTLGCKVNHYETQAMEELFVAAGHQVVPFSSQADVYIVNTCTVTQISDKKSRQMLSRAHKNNPNALIVAVGCFVQTNPKAAGQIEGVGLAIGTKGKKDIVHLCEQALKDHEGAMQTQAALTGDLKQNYGQIGTEFENLSATCDSRTRATLKIQDGCNRFCSYCIIPYARGPLRSRSYELCREEIKRLIDSGYKEIVLTGIQLCAYKDGEKDLCDIIELCDELGVHRLRLGSIEPTFVTERFVSVCKSSRCLCRQFHLSMQSGCDTVLKRMNRHYTTADYRRAVNRLLEAMDDCAITTDVICGFVGETEDEHAQTLAFVKEIGFARIHVFPYSIRKGTAAAQMEGHLTKATKDARSAELIALSEQLEQAFVKAQIGKTLEVLMENDGTGYSKNYVRVRCSGAEGTLVIAKIIGTEGIVAIGRTAD